MRVGKTDELILSALFQIIKAGKYADPTSCGEYEEFIKHWNQAYNRAWALKKHLEDTRGTLERDK